MTKKDHENFENFTKLWICIKRYEAGKEKLKDCDHTQDPSFKNVIEVLEQFLLCFMICKTIIQILSFKMLEFFL